MIIIAVAFIIYDGVKTNTNPRVNFTRKRIKTVDAED